MGPAILESIRANRINQMSTTRKLLTVFYADVVGYSRLTGEDEEGAHQRVMAILDHATAAIVASDGAVLRYSGDAILASFPSVIRQCKHRYQFKTSLQTSIGARQARSRFKFESASTWAM